MSEHIQSMPVLPLKGMTLLPGMLVHLDIYRNASKKAVEAAMASNQMIFVTAQKDSEIENPDISDLNSVGVVALIRQEIKVKDNVLRVMISTKERGYIGALSQTKPYYVVDVEPYGNDLDMEAFSYTEKEAMTRTLRDLYYRYLDENPRASRSISEKIKNVDNPEKLIDLIGVHVNMSQDKRQELLECLDIMRRFHIISQVLTEEVNIIRIKDEYRQKVKDEVDKNQKEFYLREQMKVIKKELGNDDSEDEYEEKYEEELENLECSDEIRKVIKKEINRLKTISNNSSESVVSRDYIETMLALPWERMSEDNNDIHNAKSVLDDDHYGLDKVKERILEFLSVRALTTKGESPIICLVGPPGTGKTSIAKSIARALNKKYIRICLGGVRDEAEIRGHRRTYVGAMPGRFIEGLKRAKVRNPLILLDEIDKVSSDYKGDTGSALLEVLDPEQNKNFVDHYVDQPVDLSEVLFICTANSTDTIPRPLLDRMELISLSGYTENERFHIGKDYLISKQLECNGLAKKQLSINDTALKNIISYYTKEAGVRELERQIGKICRKAARIILEDEVASVKVNSKNLEDFLGKRKYRLEKANKKADVGIVRGLAWTSVGGDTLEIEVNTMPGEGKLKLTGQLGDVMKESAEIALSLVRAKLPEENEFFKSHDFHLHVPKGAVPKDGPSAGVTMSTALFSAVTGTKVNSKVAMTGEITLRGRVLPIGGLKEKMLAAKLAGIDTVIVPKDNYADVKEIDEEIVDGMNIVYAEQFDDVWKEARI